MRRSSNTDEDPNQLGFAFGAPPQSSPPDDESPADERGDDVPASIAAQLTADDTPTPRVPLRAASCSAAPKFPNPAADIRRIWSVRELVSTIRGTVERGFSDIWLEGEISNYRPSDSGHLYFTLKDGDAQIRVVMFRSAARLMRFRPENGMRVVARGHVTVYDARGELQISAEYLEPKGAGALQVAFEQLKAKLAAEGLFDADRKRPIPMLPRTIGVVTSPRGAALHDILNVLRRRHEDVHIVIYPAQVQGESAPLEVAAGVRYFNRTHAADVIIVARGGGSIEDLAAFNDEMLARTIADSDVPVISAIGHETDFSICDFVADLRAPTPSAAAELVIEAKRSLTDRTRNLSDRLQKALRYRILISRQHLESLARNAAFERMRSGIHRRQQLIDDLRHRLIHAERRLLQQHRQLMDIAAARVRHHDVSQRLAMMHRLVEQRETQLAGIARHRLSARRAAFERLDAQLRALSPTAILERGYAIAFDGEGNVVRSTDQTPDNTALRVRVADGEIDATVNRTRRTKPQ